MASFWVARSMHGFVCSKLVCVLRRIVVATVLMNVKFKVDRWQVQWAGLAPEGLKAYSTCNSPR